MIEFVQNLIDEWWAGHLMATTITKPYEGDGEPVDTIAGWPDPESGEVGQIPATRVEMFGHAAVPPRGQRCRALLRKAAGIVFPLGSKRYRPAGMKEGESCLYCTKAGTKVWLKADGTLRIDAGGGSVVVAPDGSMTLDAAAGKDIVVHGGNAPVARQGDRCQITDPIHLGALAIWLFKVETFVNGIVPGTIAPGELSATFLADPGIIIKEGSARFKA